MSLEVVGGLDPADISRAKACVITKKSYIMDAPLIQQSATLRAVSIRDPQSSKTLPSTFFLISRSSFWSHSSCFRLEAYLRASLYEFRSPSYSVERNKAYPKDAMTSSCKTQLFFYSK